MSSEKWAGGKMGRTGNGQRKMGRREMGRTGNEQEGEWAGERMGRRENGLLEKWAGCCAAAAST